MAQWLKALVVPTEDPGSIHSTTICDSAPWVCDALLWPPQELYACGIHINTQVEINILN